MFHPLLTREKITVAYTSLAVFYKASTGFGCALLPAQFPLSIPRLLWLSVYSKCYKLAFPRGRAGVSSSPFSLGQEDILELKRQLSVADGQLRKSEVSRKRLEICNRKLLLFVQVML